MHLGCKNVLLILIPENKMYGEKKEYFAICTFQAIHALFFVLFAAF